MATLDDMIAGYLIPYSGKTVDAYQRDIVKWLQWCDLNNLDPLTIRRMHIEAYGKWRAHMGDSPATRNNRLSAICGLYRYMYDEGVIDTDPGEHVRRKRIYSHSCGSVLDKQQATAFLDAAAKSNRQDRAICTLLLLTGARNSEACKLDVPDWHDGPQPYVHYHRKGAWMQDVGVPGLAADALRALVGKRRHGPIFRSQDDRKRITHTQLAVRVAQVAKRCGLSGVTPHTLRRTFCTLSRDAGVPDSQIMAMGGWHSTQMLDYYDMAAHGRRGQAGQSLQNYLTE